MDFMTVIWSLPYYFSGFPVGSEVKVFACNVGASLVPLRLLPLLPQVVQALWPVPSASPPGGGCA